MTATPSLSAEEWQKLSEEKQHHCKVLASALEFARHKHRNQQRKDVARTPYITHPIEVCEILKHAGISDSAVLAAALLHDTVEDTDTTHAELVDTFGETIAGLVRECTDDKRLPKATRKQLQITKAAHISPSAQLVKLADKISNLRSLCHSRPVGWSDTRIRGYFDWSYLVCRPKFGQNAILDAEIKQLCAEQEGLPEEVLQQRLHEYLEAMSAAKN